MGVAGERWSEKRMNRALDAFNRILLTVARTRRFAREKLGVELEYRLLADTSDKRAYLLEIPLPASQPLVVAVYATTEESRPVTWRRLLPRLERLKRMVARYAPPARDLFLAVVAASPRTRPTCHAAAMARRAKVALGAVEEVLDVMRRYIEKRLARLVKSTRKSLERLHREGKTDKRHAWGELAQLLRALLALLEQLSAETGKPVPHSLAQEVLELAPWPAPWV